MSHGLNCPVCGSGEFGDCVCPINRQQHIDTLARLMESEVRKYPVRTSTQPWDGGIGWGLSLSGLARKVLDSTDPNLHDALIAALHANADRARVLAAHAAAGWLDEEWKHKNASGGGTICATREHAEAEERKYIHRRDNRTGYDLLSPRPPASLGIHRRLVSPWEPTP